MKILLITATVFTALVAYLWWASSYIAKYEWQESD